MVQSLSKDKCKMNLLYRCIFLSLVVSIICSVFNFVVCPTQGSGIILDGCAQDTSTRIVPCYDECQRPF